MLFDAVSSDLVAALRPRLRRDKNKVGGWIRPRFLLPTTRYRVLSFINWFGRGMRAFYSRSPVEETCTK
jgi:hypothetical protein